MLFLGDCRDVLKTFDSDSIDSIITDPPYEIGFLGKSWDRSGVAFDVNVWSQCLRVLKPGGHLLAFGGSRTYHRLAVAIEDAGFEIRDMLEWVYSSGLPKALNISKGIQRSFNSLDGSYGFSVSEKVSFWSGWHSSLKPAHEPICMARKPLSEKTLVHNVLKWGCGALNIEACRVPGPAPHHNYGRTSGEKSLVGKSDIPFITPDSGRWPSNFIHDGSSEVVHLFPESAGQLCSTSESNKTHVFSNLTSSRAGVLPRGDVGSASRFFYSVRASSSDRDSGGVKNTHPTVKPVNLMRYLCKLVTPPGGVVLDPFCGSGSTGKAAVLEKFSFYGIDLDSIEIAEKRISAAAKTVSLPEKEYQISLLDLI